MKYFDTDALVEATHSADDALVEDGPNTTRRELRSTHLSRQTYLHPTDAPWIADVLALSHSSRRGTALTDALVEAEVLRD